METEQAPAAPRKRLPRVERERQILEVAETVFATRGYQATSMDDIAQRVGLSKPMLYDYFGSKDGLLLACLERAQRELLAATTAAVQEADGPDRILHAGLLAFFRFSDEHRQAWALLRNEAAAPGDEISSGLEAIRRQQTEFTGEMLRVSLPDLDEQQLEAFAEAIIGACERLAIWRENRPEITPEKATEHLMTLVSPKLLEAAT